MTNKDTVNNRSDKKWKFKMSITSKNKRSSGEELYKICFFLLSD